MQYKVPLLLENDVWSPPTQKEILASIEQNNGRLLMETCLQREGAKNAMGRAYPYDILMREFETYQEFVSDRSAHGELDHPESAVVSLSNIAIVITKQWWDTNNRSGRKEWWGEFEILSPQYNSVASKVHGMVVDKVKFGISSRGVGSTKRDERNNVDIVEPDFVIIAFDIVSHPSTHFAHPHLKAINTPMVSDLHENSQRAHKRYMENRISMLLESRKKTKGGIIL